MNPYALLAGVLLWLATCAGAFIYGQDTKENAILAQDQRDAKVVELANKGAADAIAKIQVRNVTTKQILEREIQTNTVYADCKHSPDGLRTLNEAITGRPQPVSARPVPGASTPE